MSEDIANLLIELLHQQGMKIDKLEKKVDELVGFKNKLIAGGVVLSAIFGLIWDFVKNWFARN